MASNLEKFCSYFTIDTILKSSVLQWIVVHDKDQSSWLERMIHPKHQQMNGKPFAFGLMFVQIWCQQIHKDDDVH